MIIGKTKSEQLSATMNLVLDFDCKLSSPNEYLTVFNKYLNGTCSIIREDKKVVYHTTINDTYFLVANITYLGHPHPKFKKRIQTKNWFKNFYNKYKNKRNIKLIGIYTCDNMSIFVDFEIDKYMNRKTHNSSAHVYINDLFQALKYGSFKKEDSKGNEIIAIRGNEFQKYLQTNNIYTEPILDLFEKFNNGFSFGEWITAKDAIKEMMDDGFEKQRETEWAGFFLEKKIQDFIESEHCDDVMCYNKGKTKQFDLYFKKEHFYGDLKASDIDKNNCPLNDKEMTIESIMSNDKIWYIIYEHKTNLDKNYDNVMAVERMKLLKIPYKEGGKISYANRMKHSVNFKTMKVYELNRINYHEYLRIFNQGKQVDGSSRNPKFLLNKKNSDNLLIYTYNYK